MAVAQIAKVIGVHAHERGSTKMPRRNWKTKMFFFVDGFTTIQMANHHNRQTHNADKKYREPATVGNLAAHHTQNQVLASLNDCMWLF